MKRLKRKMEYIPCKRCKKLLASLIRPLGIGPHSQYMYDNYKGICESCLTDSERADLKKIGAL